MSQFIRCKDCGNAKCLQFGTPQKKRMGLGFILFLIFVFVLVLPMTAYAAFLFHISDTMTTGCLWTATLTESQAEKDIEENLGIPCRASTDVDGVIIVECKDDIHGTGTQMYFFAPDEATCQSIRKSVMTIMGRLSAPNKSSSPSTKESRYADEAHVSRDYSSTEAYSKSTTPSVDADGIMQAQLALKNLGYFQGTPNGVHDKQLTSALMDYQWTNKLVPDGFLDPELLKRITEDSFKK